MSKEIILASDGASLDYATLAAGSAFSGAVVFVTVTSLDYAYRKIKQAWFSSPPAPLKVLPSRDEAARSKELLDRVEEMLRARAAAPTPAPAVAPVAAPVMAAPPASEAQLAAEAQLNAEIVLARLATLKAELATARAAQAAAEDALRKAEARRSKLPKESVVASAEPSSSNGVRPAVL